MKNIFLLGVVFCFFVLTSFSQHRRVLEKFVYEIAKHLPETVVVEDPRGGKKFDITPRLEYDAETGDYKISFRNPDDSTKWAYIKFVPGTKVQVSIEARATLNSNLYTYEYTIHNQNNSKQYITTFGFEIEEGIVQRCTGPKTGNWHCFLPNATSRICFFSGGFLTNEAGDITEFTLGPGIAVSGFILESSSLPGIINCYTRGQVPPPRVTGMSAEMVPSEILDALPRPANDRLVGRTIGPVRVPATITPAQFLDRLLSMIDESFKEGWIGKEALAHQFHTLVNSAKEQLLKGNTVGGKQTLNTFLQLVETTYQRGEILSEPYGLFKYNTLYLTENLLK